MIDSELMCFFEFQCMEIPATLIAYYRGKRTLSIMPRLYEMLKSLNRRVSGRANEL